MMVAMHTRSRVRLSFLWDRHLGLLLDCLLAKRRRLLGWPPASVNQLINYSLLFSFTHERLFSLPLRGSLVVANHG